jgi:hypothetical protein
MKITAPPLAATAHADNNYQQFASRSGHIRCILNGQDTPAPIVQCAIGDHTYSALPGSTSEGGPAHMDPIWVAIFGSTKASRPT